VPQDQKKKRVDNKPGSSTTFKWHPKNHKTFRHQLRATRKRKGMYPGQGHMETGGEKTAARSHSLGIKKEEKELPGRIRKKQQSHPAGEGTSWRMPCAEEGKGEAGS